MGLTSYYLVLLTNVLVFVTHFHCTNVEESIRESLGLRRTPNLEKMNVSQENYSRMVQLHLNRREKAEEDFDLDYSVSRRFYTLSPERTETRKGNVKHFHFWDRRFRNYQVDGMVLKMFVNDINLSRNGNLTINITRDSRTRMETIVIRNERLPKWVDVFIEQPTKESIDLEVSCGPTCSIEKPTLNIFKVKHNGPERHRRFRMTRAIGQEPRYRGQPGSEQDLYVNYTEGPVPKTDCTRLLKQSRHLCCRERYEIPFRLTPGFEWILQPFSYDIGKCSGDCPQRFNPVGYHSTIHNILNQRGMGEHTSCCVAAGLKDIEVLYLDDEDETKLVVAQWHSLKASECSCS